jgi:hypothetical protein
VIFFLIFLVNLINLINHSRRGVPFVYILGMLAGNAVVPGVFWIINYFVEKKK